MTKLKTYLEELYKTYDRRFLDTDPLKFVHLYNRKEDQEIVGLISSSLAYGTVERIFICMEKVLRIMEDRPYEFVMNFNPWEDVKRFNGVQHRFTNGKDVACMLFFVKQVIENYGSLEAFFVMGYNQEEENIKKALTDFVEGLLNMDCAPFYADGVLPLKAGVRYLLPSPNQGSPCKRLNLFLRWMVRKGDGLDLGLWERVSPSKLVIPLDTHVARISQYLGLTNLKIASWKMAEDVTRSLKKLDPQDPIKYDFALCRLGIIRHCPKKLDWEKCLECSLKEVCIKYKGHN